MNLLSFGAFNGEQCAAIDADGISLAEFADRAEERIERHTHESAHFQFILKGAYITSARGLADVCGPPTVIFNPAGTTHRDRFHTRGGTFLTLSIDQSIVRQVGGHRALCERALGFSHGEVPWLGARLYRELRMPDDDSPAIITGLGLELLSNVVRKRLRGARGPARWLTAAFDMIQECSSEKLTLQGMASAAGVPPISFGRCFRKAFGCSAGEMLRRTRVARAEELLRRRTLPIGVMPLTRLNAFVSCVYRREAARCLLFLGCWAAMTSATWVAWPSAAQGFGGSTRAMTVDDQFRLVAVGDPLMSPDGNWVVYSVSRMSLSENARHSTFWLAATQGNVAARESLLEGDESPMWAPDSHSVYLLRSVGNGSRAGRELFEQRVDESTAVQRSHLGPGPDGSWQMSRDGTFFLVTRDEPSPFAPGADSDVVFVYEGSNGQSRACWSNLWRYDLNREKLIRVTRRNWTVDDSVISPDGRHAVVAARPDNQREQDGRASCSSLTFRTARRCKSHIMLFPK
jgi:AraC family transcriptional regulator